MKRHTGIDILRCILPVMIIVLHFNNSKGGAALNLSGNNVILHEILLFLEASCIGAVNIFMMLSGYFLLEKKTRKISKIIILFLELTAINAFSYIFSTVKGSVFSAHEFLVRMLPMDYFIWLYSTCFFVSVWINVLCVNLNKNQYKWLIICLALIFSVWPTIADLYINITGNGLAGMSTVALEGSGAGYTIVQFCLAYIMGGYLYRFPILFTQKKKVLYAGIIIVVIYALEHISFSYAIEYCNTFVVLSAFLIVSYFSALKINNEYKVLSKISSLSLLIYLIHCRLYILWNENPLILNLNRGTLSGAASALILIIMMYIISLLLSVVFELTIGRLLKRTVKPVKWMITIDGLEKVNK